VRGRRAAVAVLALLGVLVALARLHTYDEPLERDLTTYAVIGDELLHGKALYSELWDHKPPAVHATYAVAEFLAGRGPAAVYWLGVAAAVLTLIGVYRAGRLLPQEHGFRGVSAGLWAAAFWASICSDLRLEANQPNTEVFINAAAVWSFVLLSSAS